MQVRWLNGWLGVRRSTTRLPFRYGRACLTWCPQAIYRATVEIGGVAWQGFSGDCFPPSWFDKSPEKSFESQQQDMIAAARLATDAFRESFARPVSFFDGWWTALEAVQAEAKERGWPNLLGSFGVSLPERATIDAMARAAGMSFAELVQANLLGIDPARWDSRLAGLVPRDWLPPTPRRQVFVRHTVGLTDPLTSSEIPPADRLQDGQPQALEEYVQQSGVRYLKIKVVNQLDRDLDRLEIIARLMQRLRGGDYRVTLDGNEQYQDAAEFDRLIAAIKSRSSLGELWQRTLLIEQPLPRDLALVRKATEGIRSLASEKPVIIDESDQTLTSYREAVELGYRGVSSKSCKGPLKSLLNAGLTWWLNQPGNSAERGPRAAIDVASQGPAYLMSGEDLCCVGIVPVQTDLCLAATLGLEHVERNGHHYHPGLAYLPAAQQHAAWEAHPDLYDQRAGIVRPIVRDGQFHIGSLQCVGFGFKVLPDVHDYDVCF